MYEIVAIILEVAQRKRDTKAPSLNIKLKEGDSMLFKDHTADV